MGAQISGYLTSFIYCISKVGHEPSGLIFNELVLNEQSAHTPSRCSLLC